MTKRKSLIDEWGRPAIPVCEKDFEALRSAIKLAEPHEHREGMNECSICDESLLLAAARIVGAMPYKSPTQSWRPIDTIPKDKDGDPEPGEFLLLVKSRAGVPYKCLVGHWMPGGCCIEDHPPVARGWHFWNGAMFDRASDPTHWMRLPEPPKPLDNTKKSP